MGPDDEVDIDSRVNSEVGDLTDDGGRSVDVEDSLVDSHFVAIPGVGTITARRTSASDSELLGGNSSGAVGFVTLMFRSGNDFSAGSF